MARPISVVGAVLLGDLRTLRLVVLHDPADVIALGPAVETADEIDFLKHFSDRRWALIQRFGNQPNFLDTRYVRFIANLVIFNCGK